MTAERGNIKIRDTGNSDLHAQRKIETEAHEE